MKYQNAVAVFVEHTARLNENIFTMQAQMAVVSLLALAQSHNPEEFRRDLAAILGNEESADRATNLHISAAKLISSEVGEQRVLLRDATITRMAGKIGVTPKELAEATCRSALRHVLTGDAYSVYALIQTAMRLSRESSALQPL